MIDAVTMDATGSLGPLLLTWINFDPSMDNQSHAQ